MFVALAEQATSGSFGPHQGRLMKQLDLDFENLLAAHAWCQRTAAGGERDLRIVTGLHRYWLNRALLSLGYRVTQEALHRAGAEGSDHLLREALTLAGRLGARIGLYEQAMQAHDKAIAIARQTGAPEMLATALTYSGMSWMEQGDLASARVQIEEAVVLSRDVGTAIEPFGNAPNELGELERLAGNWTRARSIYETSLAQARRQGDRRAVAVALNNLIMTAIAQGSATGIHEWLLESVAVMEEVSVSYGRPFALILCAGLAALKGDWEQSARFEGAATFHFTQLGWPLDPADKRYVDSLSALTRATLGEAAFERLHATGRGLALDEALAQMRQHLKLEP